METKDNYKKLCSFYVSDIHFGTMLLPYVSKKLKEKNSVYTIFEKNMYKNIEQIISNLNLNKDIKEELKNIDWDKKIERKGIKNYINNIKANDEVVLVLGNKKYIDGVNKKLKKQVTKEKIENMTIINFYDVDVFNKNMSEILNSHDGILNTSGERKIEI